MHLLCNLSIKLFQGNEMQSFAIIYSMMGIDMSIDIKLINWILELIWIKDDITMN